MLQTGPTHKATRPFGDIRDKPVSATYVYMIVHSHTDLGWLETARDYYKYKVRQIINSTIIGLAKDNRRFTFHD